MPGEVSGSVDYPALGHARREVPVQPDEHGLAGQREPGALLRAGFSFELNKAITYGFGTPTAKTDTATDNIDTVGVGKKVTGLCGGTMHFGSVDLGNPGYVTAD